MCEISKYPDGTSYVTMKANRTGLLTFRLNSYEDLWHLNQLVDVYNHGGIRPMITIPNLIDAQADRRFRDDQSSGLKLVLKFLSELKADFKIFHPHNAEVVEAMMDNVEIIDNKRFINLVLHNIASNDKSTYPDKLENVVRGPQGTYRDGRLDENLVLMSADAGGFKPLMKLSDQIRWDGQVHSCSKGRSYDGYKSELTQRIGKDDFLGKDILIVDDICVYGGTFKGLAKLLRQRNCGKIYLAVSHITIQNHLLREKTDTTVFDHFDHIFTTNSKYNEYFTENKFGDPWTPENLTIIKRF